MKITAALAASLTLAFVITTHAAGTSILFIGNSFLFGSGSAVRFLIAPTRSPISITKASAACRRCSNPSRGKPGSTTTSRWKRAAVSGSDFHLANKMDAIGVRGYDAVAMHGYSTLDADKPRDPAKLIATAQTDGGRAAREERAKVDLFLIATWSRADQTYPAKGALAGQPIEATGARRARRLRQGRRRRVGEDGDSGRRGLDARDSDRHCRSESVTTGSRPAILILWTYDNYHASTHGYYLEALMYSAA